MQLESQRTAVVAVHLQGDVVSQEGAFGGFFAAIVERTGVLARSADVIAAARSAGAPIARSAVTA